MSRPRAPYDPLDRRVQADPYPYYAALRREAPVSPVPSLDGWAVSRYDDVRHVLDHPGLFSSRPMAQADRLLLGCDPPDHRITRERVQPLFGRDAVRRLEAGIRKRCAALADQLVAAPAPELVSGLAVPLPVTTIAELFGIEHADHARFAAWSKAYVDRVSRGAEQPGGADPKRETVAFRQYIRGLVEARRERPGADFISVLADPDASQDVEGVVDLCMLLLVVGNETTTNVITNAVNALLESPGLLAEAIAEPPLAAAIVRETLRYDPPVQHVLRLATEDVELAGATIPRGATVLALIASANRDETRFAEAERFDPRRRRERPHVAFGSGIHACIGAHLGELQAAIALRSLLERCSRIGRGSGRVRRLQSFQIRGLRALPLALAPR